MIKKRPLTSFMIRFKYSLSAAGIIIVCSSILFWLGLSLFTLVMVFLATRIFKRHRIAFYSMLTIFVVVTAVFVRTFLFEVYNVSSGSMENALFKGDKVLVSKALYGPIIPKSALNFPILKEIFSSASQNDVQHDACFPRLKGLSEIRRNDIMVFKLSPNQEDVLIKRCVALPGERIEIENEIVKVNGKALFEPMTIKNLYTVIWGSSLLSLKKFAHEIEIRVANSVQNDHSIEFEAYMTVYQMHLMQLATNNKVYILPRHASKDLNKWPKSLNWSYLRFGDFVIPYRGMRIKGGYVNAQKYNFIIGRFEGLHSGHVDISKVSEYTFKKNYYFFLGDNRSISIDSRYWGVVPKENIEGKAVKLF